MAIKKSTRNWLLVIILLAILVFLIDWFVGSQKHFNFRFEKKAGQTTN
jgi:hypothetical protein